MRNMHPEEAARQTAQRLLQAPPEPDKVLSPDDLFVLAGVQEIVVVDRQSAKDRDLWVMQFTQSLLWEMMALSSRLLVNIWGEGWRLSDPSEVTGISESKFWDRVQKGFRNFTRTMKFLDGSRLTPIGRQEKQEAVQRIQAAKFALSSSMQTATVRRARNAGVKP